MRRFIRTCQECGHRIATTDPTTFKGGVSDAYLNKACPKCRSEAFDYGSWQHVDEHMQHIPHDYTKDDEL